MCDGGDATFTLISSTDWMYAFNIFFLKKEAFDDTNIYVCLRIEELGVRARMHALPFIFTFKILILLALWKTIFFASLKFYFFIILTVIKCDYIYQIDE